MKDFCLEHCQRFALRVIDMVLKRKQTERFLFKKQQRSWSSQLTKKKILKYEGFLLRALPTICA